MNEKPKKTVLIIGNFWPYCSGSGRVIGLANYLPKFRWQPIILTAPLDYQPTEPYEFIEAPYKEPALNLSGKILESSASKKIAGAMKYSKKGRGETSVFYNFLKFVRLQIFSLIYFPDKYKHWKSSALVCAHELIKNRKIDAILSIWPVTGHLIAKRLKQDYSLPWVADFPDLWSQNHNYPYGHLRRFFDQKLEQKTLAYADALSTVSEPWRNELQSLHTTQKTYCVTHGFDPKTLNTNPCPQPKKFTITYTGAIYKNKQDPEKFFTAVHELISEGKLDPDNMEINFFGPNLGFIDLLTQKYQLNEIVKYHGEVPLEEAFKKQREAHLLLLVNFEDPNITGWHSLKIYAYLAAQRPILICGGTKNNNVMQNVLKETRAGIYAPLIEDIKTAINDFYVEFKQNNSIAYQGIAEAIQEYNHETMAKKFANILNDITNA